MLRGVLGFFQKELSDYCQRMGLAEYQIQFPKGEDQTRESIDFTYEALNLLLVNLEEETTVRKGDPFQGVKNGASFPALPPVPLNLYLLFVANRSDYLTSMEHLSYIIQYFQSHRVFKQSQKNIFKQPLPKQIEMLTVELVTLPFAQQNEIWNALRTSYKPSLLYKVRMVVFYQEEPLQRLPDTETLLIDTTK